MKGWAIDTLPRVFAVAVAVAMAIKKDPSLFDNLGVFQVKWGFWRFSGRHCGPNGKQEEKPSKQYAHGEVLRLFTMNENTSSELK